MTCLGIMEIKFVFFGNLIVKCEQGYNWTY